MTADLMLYGIATSALIGLAGLAIEFAMARASLPRRGCWITVLVLSISLPTAMLMKAPPARAPESGAWVTVPTAPVRTPLARHELDSPVPAAGQPAGSASASAPLALPSLDRVLRWLWMATSAGMLFLYVLSALRLRRSSRSWRCQRVDAQEVWITPDLGPAVLGCARPRVLLPRWVLDLPARYRRLILTHELQHAAGRDACLLLVGLLVVAVAPWNVFLWWQLRRLRFAIEVDCDARVLERNADVRGYGEALLLVAGKALTSGPGFALTEATSQLERRIEVMVERRARRSWAVLAACVGLSLAFIAAAVELNAPRISSASVLRRPPPEYHNPYLQAAEAAARAGFPELFQGKLSGSVEIQVGLDRNGAVLGVDQRRGAFVSARLFAAFPWGARWLANPLGWAATHGYEVQDTIVGPTKLLAWQGPDNRDKLYLSFDVIKWPYDPKRSAELVRDAVAARYPGTLRVRDPVDGTLASPGATGVSAPVVADQASPHFTHLLKLAAVDPFIGQPRERRIKLITVFMNENGTINRSDVREFSSPAFEPPRSAAVFVQMGIGADQLAHRGVISQLTPGGRDQEILVDYAWPRRPTDPPDDADAIIDEIYGSAAIGASAARDEAFDRAVMERYFPDLWQNRSSQEQEKLPWVLLDRRGNIQATGTARVRPALLLLSHDLQLVYPGIETGEWVRSPVRSPAGQTIWLTCIWIAADSPLADLSSYDPARRSNVSIDAHVPPAELRTGTAQ
jgi:beta-lactamase regulating signal transducer with metallopeptidase domain